MTMSTGKPISKIILRLVSGLAIFAAAAILVDQSGLFSLIGLGLVLVGGVVIIIFL